MDATKRNMKILESAGIKVEAFDPDSGERFSATSGDYWHLGDDEVLTSECGEPMKLGRTVCHWVDADALLEQAKF